MSLTKPIRTEILQSGIFLHAAGNNRKILSDYNKRKEKVGLNNSIWQLFGILRDCIKKFLPYQIQYPEKYPVIKRGIFLNNEKPGIDVFMFSNLRANEYQMTN